MYQGSLRVFIQVSHKLQVCFSIVLLVNDGGNWGYLIFVPPPYLFACSLPGYEEERGKDLWKIVGDLPTASCDSLPRPLSLSGGVCGGDLSMTPGVTLLMPFHEFLRALWRKKNILSFPMHSILQPLGLFWEGFVQIDYWFVWMQWERKTLNLLFLKLAFHFEGCQNEHF